MLKEFKPSILFLIKFLVVYLIGNVLYGLWIMSFDKRADMMTSTVTHQTAFVLGVCGENTSAVESKKGPTVRLKKDGYIILNVFEGCNGINVMIVFAAFVFAFGGSSKRMLWFIPAGLIVIHLFNLIRISLLYVVAQHYQHYFYYVHKYIFTAALYVIVLLLWVLWVMKLNVARDKGNQ